jgi:tetratricopeptide (TPR) repeat protein
LPVSQEAVAIYRRLTEARPGAFMPVLATSLHNLCLRLSNLGRAGEALTASQEAVAIRRRLAQARADAFLPFLAQSMAALSGVLTKLGRHAEAEAAAREALEIVAPFVERQPAAFGALARNVVIHLMNHGAVSSWTPNFALIERIKRALGDPKPSE